MAFDPKSLKIQPVKLPKAKPIKDSPFKEKKGLKLAKGGMAKSGRGRR